MGTWKVDTNRKPGILWLELEGVVTLAEMASFVAAHNAAVDRFAGKDYKVFCDIRKLSPLTAECADLFEKAKNYSNAHRNFRGSAVWVSSAVVSMQHRRTSVSGGVINTELISNDEQALWKHLNQVYRDIPSEQPDKRR